MKALIANHAGKSYWDNVMKTADEFINNRQWTGIGSLTLETHTNGHRKSYMALKEADAHISNEIPTARTRVKKFLSSIVSHDPKLLAAMAAVNQDETGI